MILLYDKPALRDLFEPRAGQPADEITTSVFLVQQVAMYHAFVTQVVMALTRRKGTSLEADRTRALELLMPLVCAARARSLAWFSSFPSTPWPLGDCVLTVSWAPG